MDTRTTYHSISQAEATIRARGGELTFIVWTGSKYEERPIRNGFGGCLIGRTADINAAVASAKERGYSFGMVVPLDQLTTLEALDGAIEMLTKIKDGGNYNLVEYIERLQKYEEARDAQRRRELADAAVRASIRQLAEQRRAS